MCGICGTFNITDAELIKRMVTSLKHRGPDDSGVYIDDRVMLGNTRLSIIDIKGGKQPIHNEDESIWAVYNGEIYNYKQLTEELERLGHKFYTKSDTEVICHAYEQWGTDFPLRFNGMFAIALWDSNLKRLYLIRDRIGIKPLYYTVLEDKIIFGSEIKAILQCDDVTRKINYAAIGQEMEINAVLTPQTHFENIFALKSANMLIADKNGISFKEYWQPSLGSDAKKADLFRELYERIKRSVEMRLISEVPLGVFLSGGIDSSTILASMNELGIENIKTFSIGFDVPALDEMKYSRLVAQHFNTDHSEIIVGKELCKELPEALWHNDVPFRDLAPVSFKILSKKAKERVTVVLSGSGADEEFGGYTKSKFMTYHNWYHKMPRLMKDFIVPTIIGALPPENKYRMRLPLIRSSSNPSEAYYNYLLHGGYSPKMYSRELREKILKEHTVVREFDRYFKLKTNMYNKLTILDAGLSLPSYDNPTLDKMTMAHGIESRVPFLDHTLLEFSLKIPQKLKLHRNVEKYVLKKAMHSILPIEITSRKKWGFMHPYRNWLEQGLKDSIIGYLDEKGTRFTNKEFLKKLLRTKITGDDAIKLWNLFFLEVWAELFIDNEPKEHQKGIKRISSIL